MSVSTTPQPAEQQGGRGQGDVTKLNQWWKSFPILSSHQSQVPALKLDRQYRHPSRPPIYTTLISADFLTAKIVRITQHFWTIWNHHWLRNDHWPCLIKPRLQNMKILVWLHQSQEAVDSIKIICSGAAAASLSVLVSHIRQTNTLKWLDA